MIDIAITLPADTLLELALASVIPGMESQYFEDYSPQARPIAMDHGATPVACFNVLEAVTDAPTPTIGAFIQWSSLNAHRELASDPGFLAIKNRRNETMSYLSSGHFFAVAVTTNFTIETDTAYAIIVASVDVNLPETALSLRLSDASPNMDGAGRTLKIAKWTQEAQMLSDMKRSYASIYKIRFNPTDTDGPR